MILRHERNPVDGQPAENTFCAVDERTGSTIASSVIYTEYNEDMYPVRPLQLRIQIDHTSEAPDALVGATIARAREICEGAKSNARIYIHCSPDNTSLLNRLSPFGFETDDALLLMRRDLPIEESIRIPTGCEIVTDELSDRLERKYFLERYNRLFHTDHDIEWLTEYIDKPDFLRILTVSKEGIAGEILVWRENTTGVIGFFQTAKKWRRLGVGTCMLMLACESFEELDLSCVEVRIRKKYPHVMRMMNRLHFEPVETLMHYPGIDVNTEG